MLAFTQLKIILNEIIFHSFVIPKNWLETWYKKRWLFITSGDELDIKKVNNAIKHR